MAPFEKKQTRPNKFFIHPSNIGFLPSDLNDLDPADFPGWEFHKSRGPISVAPKGKLVSEGKIDKEDKYSIFQDFGPGDPIKYKVGTVGKEPGYSAERKKIESTVPITTFSMNIKNAKGRESSEFLDADELRKIEAFAKKVKEKKTELYKKRKEEGIDFGRITAEIQPRVQKMAKAEERRWLEEHNPVVLNAIDEIDKSRKRIEEYEKDMMYLSLPLVEDRGILVPLPTVIDDVWNQMKIWDYKMSHPENQEIREDNVDWSRFKGERGFLLPEMTADTREVGQNLIRPRDLVEAQRGDPRDGTIFGVLPSRLNFPLHKDWYKEHGKLFKYTLQKGGEDGFRMLWSVGSSMFPMVRNYKRLQRLNKLEREYRFKAKELKIPEELSGPSFLGKKMGLGAWTNTQMVMAGITGGAGLGPLHYELLDETLRDKLELGPKPLGEKTDQERFRDYIVEETFYEGMGLLIGVGGGKLLRGVENVFMGDKVAKRNLMEFARVNDIPISLAMISDKNVIKQFYPNVFGRFPFVDVISKRGVAGGNIGFFGLKERKLFGRTMWGKTTEGTFPAIERSLQKDLNQLAPRIGFESLSTKLHKNVGKAYDENIGLAATAYRSANLSASRLPKQFQNFIPTSNIKNYTKNLKKGVLKDILASKQQAYRFGEYEKLGLDELAQIPGLSIHQKKVIRYLKTLDELPSHISIGQYQQLDDELWEVYSKYGKDLGGTKQAILEKNMKWSTLRKAMEQDRLHVTRQGRNLSGMNAEKLKKDGYKLQKVVGEGDAEKWVDADPNDLTAIWRNPDTGMEFNPSYIERFFKKQAEGMPMTKEMLDEAKENLYDAIDALNTGDLWYGKYVKNVGDLKVSKLFAATDDNFFSLLHGDIAGKSKMGPDVLFHSIGKTMLNPQASGGTRYLNDLIKIFPRGEKGRKLFRQVFRTKLDDVLNKSYTDAAGKKFATLKGEPIKVFDYDVFRKEMGFDVSLDMYGDQYRMIKETLLLSQRGGGKKLNKESLKLLNGIKNYNELLKLAGTMPIPESSTFAARGAVFAVGGAAAGAGGYFGGAEGAAMSLIVPISVMRFGSTIINNPQFADTVMSAVSNGPKYFTKYTARQAFGEAFRYQAKESGLWDQTIDAHIDEIINSEGYNPQAIEALAQSIYLKESSPEAGLKGPQNKITDNSEVLAYLDKEIINKDKTLDEKVSEELSARYPGRKIQEIDLIPPSGRTPQRTVMEGDREYISPSPLDKPQTRPTVMGQSTLPANMYGSMFPGDTLGAGIAQQQQTAQGPQQRTSLMASGGIALATPAAQLSGKVLENQAARNIMSTFWGTPMQQTVQNMLLTGTAKARDPRPEGQVKLSTLYDPQGKWTGLGPEPTGVSAPEGKEAWFTPGEQIKDPHSALAVSGMQWSDLVRHGYDPWTRKYPGAGTYKPGKVHYEYFDPVSTSASAITQQDPSRYRVAGFNQGGILSTKKAKQMVA